jgi:hypothetical protein
MKSKKEEREGLSTVRVARMEVDKKCNFSALIFSI